MYTYRILYESIIGERILKIGQHFPKLLLNIKGLIFFGHSVLEVGGSQI